MLTVIFLMRALDPVKYKDETYDLLSRLMECDAMRKGYYKDLRKYLTIVMHFLRHLLFFVSLKFLQ